VNEVFYLYPMLTQDDIKKQVAIRAAQLVQSNMTIGLGTGSTAYWLIMELGRRIKEGLLFRAVPTSKKTAMLAAEHNIPLAGLNDVDIIDLTIDGADEVDSHLQLIKGGGGALLQEKMVAAASRELLIIVDHTKKVHQLGAFPLPLDVIPFGWKQVQRHVKETWHIDASLRMNKDEPLVTDHGHYILDCHFKTISNPETLDYELKSIPGVAECGLFINMADMAVIGYPDGKIETLNRP
jgi:ribose 5-phosphate isomerase A